jgi:hypothetical protein
MDEFHRIGSHRICLTTLTNYSLLGATNSEVAFCLGIEEALLLQWMDEDPFVASAVHKGQAIADGNVANALYRCAVGYKGREAKVIMVMEQPRVIEYDQYFQPQISAAKFWLERRRPALWGARADAAKPASEAEAASKTDGIRTEIESRYHRIVDAAAKGGLDKRPIQGRA